MKFWKNLFGSAFFLTQGVALMTLPIYPGFPRAGNMLTTLIVIDFIAVLSISFGLYELMVGMRNFEPLPGDGEKTPSAPKAQAAKKRK